MLVPAGLSLCAFALALGQVQAYLNEGNLIENGNITAEVPEMFIVSGWVAYPGQHPQQAALRMVGPHGQVSGCGGTLVHALWVLTAAHCTAGQVTVVVRAGLTNMTAPLYMLETTEWYHHPTYNDENPTAIQPNDISVVKLPIALVFNRLVQPIRLQSSADAYKDYSGQIMYSSGFGRIWSGGPMSEELMWVYLRGMSNAACERTFGNIVTDVTLCARFYNVTEQSTCQGDNGGPLVVVEADGEPELVGITAFVAGGADGCHSGHPAGFVRVGPFHEWLRNVTGVDFENIGGQEEDDDDEDEDEGSEEDPEVKDLMQKLEIQVNVKVKVKKYFHKVNYKKVKKL